MSQGDTPITLIGNLVADPELRYTPSGAPVATMRVASTPRTYNREAGQWEDGEALFLTCNIWRQAAENAAQSLTKGTRVVVVGKLKQRNYQTKDGSQRTSYEIEAEEIAVSTKYAAVVTGEATAGNTQSDQQQTGDAQDGWGNPAPTGGFTGGFS